MKKLLVATLYALVIGGLGYGVAQNINRSVQLSQSPLGPIGFDTANAIYFPAHVNMGDARAPTLGTTFGTGGTIVGSDTAGEIHLGTSPGATGGSMTFRTAYTSTPYCTGSMSRASPVGLYPSPNGVNFLLDTNGRFAGDKINYHCIGRATG